MRRTNQRGQALLETAMLIPILLMLLVGMVQIGRLTYTYYTLRKTVYSIATFLSTQQGVNFCDIATDPTIAAAVSFGITGTTDNTQPAIVTGLTSAMINVDAQQIDSSGNVTEYGGAACVESPPFAGAAPDFIVVSIPDGYQYPIRIPYIPQMDPILLKPVVKVPYGGT